MKAASNSGSKIEVKTDSNHASEIQMQGTATRLIKAVLTCTLMSAVVTTLVACQPNNASNATSAGATVSTVETTAQGPGGTGGGNAKLQQSSIEEVEAVVDQEFDNLSKSFVWLALEPFFRKNADNTVTLSKYANALSASKNPGKDLKRLIEIMVEFDQGGVSVDSSTNNLFSFARFDAVLPRLKLDKRREQACDDSDNQHFDGSAQKTTICMSLTRLTRIPQSALKNEIRALLNHELMHVLGYGEADADLMQRYFLFDISQSRTESRSYLWKTLEDDKTNAAWLSGQPGVSEPFLALRDLSGVTGWLDIVEKQFLRLTAKSPEKLRFADQRNKLERARVIFFGVVENKNSGSDAKTSAYLNILGELTATQDLIIELLPLRLERKTNSQN